MCRAPKAEKTADGMRISQDCKCDTYNVFADWAPEAKNAQFVEHDEILDRLMER